MTQSIRILHIVTELNRGGAEKQLAYLAHLQTRLGHRVFVEYLTGEPNLQNRLESSGVEVGKAGSSAFAILKIWRIIKLVRKNDISLIHAHLPKAELFATIIKLFTNSRLVVSRHNTEPFWPKGPRCVSRYLALTVESSADQIVCISNAVQKFTFDSFESRIFSKYVVVPYTWIPKDFFEKDPLNAVQNSKALKGTRYNLICVSRLVKQKNLKTLIRAVSLLSPSINLEIFGSGPLKLELENLISELKLSKRVFLMGHVPDVESRLRNYQLFILASNYEGFGLSVMEAVVQGIPVVLAKNPALLEIMGENYPFFFEPNDVLEMSEIITKAVNSPRSLVEPFFKRVIREYGPERLMNSMENVYTKALGRKIYE